MLWLIGISACGDISTHELKNQDHTWLSALHHSARWKKHPKQLHAEIDRELLGSWKVVNDPIWDSRSNFLYVSPDEFVFAGNFVNDTMEYFCAQLGQIFYELDKQKMYLFDYYVEDDELYLLIDKSELYHNPINNIRAFKLIKE